MRIQVEFDEVGTQLVKKLMEQTGITTYKELFNNAVALFSWAVNQREKGNKIASINEGSHEFRELQMHPLEYAAERVNTGRGAA